MTRNECIEALMWNQGGASMGICSVATTMMMAMMPKPRKEDDWKSVVAISGSPDDYTDEELVKLVEFSKQRTERYDKMFDYRKGANLICIGKFRDGSWLRKRLSWDMGPMFSPTLDEALKVFERD